MYLKEMFLLSCHSCEFVSNSKEDSKLFNDKLISFNVKIVYMLTVRVNSFFTFKDKLSKMLPFRHAGLLHKSYGVLRIWPYFIFSQ